MKKVTVALFGFILFFLANSAFAQIIDLDQDGIFDHIDPDVVVSVNLELPAGEYNFLNLTITNNATLFLDGDPDSTSTFKGVRINAETLTVDDGASINADNSGYGSPDSPGFPDGYQGGFGYGGKGGNWFRNSVSSFGGDIYGSALIPKDLGSGGNSISRGGGAIWLSVSGTFINNGTLSANGWRIQASGGSIYVDTNNLSGSGIFKANGASCGSWPYRGAGGGGRIAIHYEQSSFMGETEVLRGGTGSYIPCLGSRSGEDGTVVFVDTTNNNLHVYSSFRLQLNDGPFEFNTIIFESNAGVVSEDNISISADKLIMRGNANYTSSAGQHFAVSIIELDDNARLWLTGEETLLIESLHLKGSSVLETPNGIVLNLDIPIITIDSGALINATNKGLADRYGLGAGSGGSEGGYGHGGKGGDWYYRTWSALGGDVYDSETEPVMLGNGPNALSRGGGAVRINSDTLTIDGAIRADGGSSQASGGSIYITTKILNGAGTITANGASCYQWPGSGAGGGGRIAVYYDTSTFDGSVIASAGGRPGTRKSCSGVRVGQDGTIVFEQSVDGYSNVAFLPGLQASRLYKQQVFENQLWEPNINADVEKLYLDDSGTSIDGSIYTRDIIDEALGFNIYKKFSESMDTLVDEGIIQEWQAMPYDWRMSLEDVLDNDVELGSGETYNIINSIEELAQNSATGKVTIIGHSNGGLLGKLLISKLEEEGKGDLIDTFIMVGTPQLGTPSAIMALLHGGERGVLKGWLPNHEVTRELGENMQSAYTLLPSPKYFDVVDTIAQPIVEFAMVDATDYLRGVYGNTISTLSNLVSFMKGEDGVRTEPAPDNVDEPNVLAGQFLSEADVLQSTLDAWVPPTGVNVVQIAGWGLDTLRGVEYVEQEKRVCNEDLSVCTNQSFLDPKPMFTQDGDKTVVISSAVAMNVEKYYLNLVDYNRSNFRFRRNRDHADILEVDFVRELIRKIITEDVSILPDHFSTTKPLVSDSTMRIAMHSPVEVHIYDDFGNHTGIIFNPDIDSDIVLIEEQIPNSYYLEFGEGKYLGIGTNEEYRIELRGEGLGTFTFEIEEVLGDEVVSTVSYENIPVSASTTATFSLQNLNTIPELALDVDGDGIVDVTLTGGEEDTQASFEILAIILDSMNIHHGLKQDLTEKVKQAQKELSRGKPNKAVKKLDDIIKKLEEEIKKNTKQKDKDKKQKISTADAQVLIYIVTQLKVEVI